MFNTNKIINFMSKRNIFLAISLTLIAGAIFSLAFKGLNFGIDFKGGVVVQVKFPKKAPISEVRKLIGEHYNGAIISNFGTPQEIVIKLPTKSVSGNVATDIGDKVTKILAPLKTFKIRRVDIVGATVGNELTQKGIKALIFAIIGILIYVAFRFEWRFAVASVFALIHDLTISIGAVSLTQTPVNLDVLAALLTILGYSLNDTIVVFDRIREEINKTSSKDLKDIINISVTKTLSRTTLTSLTTFFVVLTLFLFGGEIIKPFSFTLLVGIIVGTYSSIFIASPLLIWFGFKIDDFRKKEALKEKRKREKERLRAMYEQGRV